MDQSQSPEFLPKNYVMPLDYYPSIIIHYIFNIYIILYITINYIIMVFFTQLLSRQGRARHVHKTQEQLKSYVLPDTTQSAAWLTHLRWAIKQQRHW